jgi:hypothetical protein
MNHAPFLVYDGTKWRTGYERLLSNALPRNLI